MIPCFSHAQEATGKSPNVVYASSAAILGPAADYPNPPVPDDYYHKPATIYGAAQKMNGFQILSGRQGWKPLDELPPLAPDDLGLTPPFFARRRLQAVQRGLGPPLLAGPPDSERGPPSPDLLWRGPRAGPHIRPDQGRLWVLTMNGCLMSFGT